MPFFPQTSCTPFLGTESLIKAINRILLCSLQICPAPNKKNKLKKRKITLELLLLVTMRRRRHIFWICFSIWILLTWRAPVQHCSLINTFYWIGIVTPDLLLVQVGHFEGTFQKKKLLLLNSVIFHICWWTHWYNNNNASWDPFAAEAGLFLLSTSVDAFTAGVTDTLRGSFPGVLTNTMGGEGEDDQGSCEHSEKWRLSGSLQRPHFFSLPSGGESNVSV